MTLVEAYAGEIRLFTNTFAPRGWALCDGRLVSVEEYPVLFALIGATYGGDGVTTFGLPDLRGRLPVGADVARVPGTLSAGVGVASGSDFQTQPTLSVNYIICLHGVYPDQS
jgi:microcystin-dependent protein